MNTGDPKDRRLDIAKIKSEYCMSGMATRVCRSFSTGAVIVCLAVSFCFARGNSFARETTTPSNAVPITNLKDKQSESELLLLPVQENASVSEKTEKQSGIASPDEGSEIRPAHKSDGWPARVWSFPEPSIPQTAVKSNIYRIAIPNSGSANPHNDDGKINYARYAQTLAGNIRRDFSDGTPALLFFATNLPSEESQSQFAAELSRLYPDSILVGVSVPYFFTRDGILTGVQAAVWPFGGADIRVSAAFQAFDDYDSLDNLTDGNGLAIQERFQTWERILLRTNRDAATLLIYRLPDSKSSRSGQHIQIRLSSFIRQNEELPIFSIPVSSRLSGALFFGGKRYSFGLIGLVISGSIKADTQPYGSLGANDNPAPLSAIVCSSIDPELSEESASAQPSSSVLSLDSPRQAKRANGNALNQSNSGGALALRENLQDSFDDIQTKLGKLTPLFYFPFSEPEPPEFQSEQSGPTCIRIFASPSK